MKRFSQILGMSVLLANLAGCNLFDPKTIKTPNYSPEIAFPLAKTNFTLQDIIDQVDSLGYVGTDPDGLIKVVFRSNVLSLKGEDLYSLPNITAPLLDSVVNVPVPSTQNEQITRMDLKSGTFSYNFSSNQSVPLTVTISIPASRKNNLPFTHSFTIPANGNMTGTVPLDGYRIDMSSASFVVKYDARTPAGQRIRLNTNPQAGFQNLKYSYIEGKMGQFNFNLPLDSVSLSIFTAANGGNVYFEDPRVTFIFNNSYGVPIRARANALYAITGSGNIPLNNADLTNGFDFAYPSLSQVGQFASSFLTLNKNNSNIATIIGARPTELVYDMNATCNPNNLPGLNTFITDSSRFDVDAEVELPLYGRANGFTVRDTLALTLADGDFDVISSVRFRLVTENEFPTDVSFQAYFINSGGAIIDSIFSGPSLILKAASVDGSGRVIAAEKSISTADMDANRYDRVKRLANRLVLKGTIATLNNGSTSVKFYNDYQLTTKLGLMVGIN